MYNIEVGYKALELERKTPRQEFNFHWVFIYEYKCNTNQGVPFNCRTCANISKHTTYFILFRYRRKCVSEPTAFYTLASKILPRTTKKSLEKAYIFPNKLYS